MDCSRVTTRGTPARTAPTAGTSKGRASGALEPCLRVKTHYVQAAIEQKMLQWSDKLGKWTPAGGYKHPVTLCGMAAVHPLRKVERWAAQRIAERWQEFGEDARMREVFGADPLQSTMRIPKMWSGARLGRPAFDELYKDAYDWIHKELSRLHTTGRTSGLFDDMDWEVIYNTWCSLVADWNRSHTGSQLLGDRADGAFSIAHVRKFCRVRGFKSVQQCSTEPKRVDPLQNSQFRTELDQKMQEWHIDPRALQSYDEYNEFYQLPRKHIIVNESVPEAQPAHGRLGARRRPRETVHVDSVHQRHVTRASNGRRTVSAAVVYGPLHKGPVMLLVDQCAKETLELIHHDLGYGRGKGKLLVLIRNETGSCHGSTHVHRRTERRCLCHAFSGP